MAQIYYVEVGGYSLNELADAVSTHLNFIGTGLEKIKLDDIAKITIEDVGQVGMPHEIYREFGLLAEKDQIGASKFRNKLIHQWVTSRVMFTVYENIRENINVTNEVDLHKPIESIIFDIPSILTRIRGYKETIVKFYGEDFHLEKHTRNIFQQVAAPRLDGLALSQAELGADIDGLAVSQAELNAGVTKLGTDSEKQRAAMEARLLDAIKKLENKTP